MPKINVPNVEMQNLLYEKSAVVRDQIVSHDRWSVGHELIFRRDGKLYRTRYSVGATENQDEGPFEYGVEIECTEVCEVQKTITDYAEAE